MISATFISLTITSTMMASAHGVDQVAKLLPNDGAPYLSFGQAVAATGSMAVIGAPGYNGDATGAAYVFDLASAEEVAMLLAEDGAASDHFGLAVAVDESTAIIGAPMNDDVGSASAFDLGSARQSAYFTPEAPVDGLFAMGTAIDGPSILIGSPASESSGAAFLYDATSGQLLASLVPNDGELDDFFGFSVALDYTTAVIGAPINDEYDVDSGSAYVFDISTGNQTAKLTPTERVPDELFGLSVDIDGHFAVVGAPGDIGSGLAGAAYVFDLTTAKQIATLVANDGAAGDGFGWSVAIKDDLVLVGASMHDGGHIHSGAAYIFDANSGEQLAKLVATDGTAQDNFGGAVAISGTLALIGAPGDDDNGPYSGSAYIFNLADFIADFNDDGTIGIADLVILLGAWGDCPAGHACAADLSGDSVVNVQDLLVLLSAWN